MVMPSGRRSSEPVPRAERQRQRAEERRHRRHHDRAGSAAGTPGRSTPRATCPRSRSASSAKSIIMIAFFLTMPMSRMMPMSAMTLNSVRHDDERQERADARRRQRRQDRDRVDVALVEHAEHDVDGEQRGEDQERLATPATRGRPPPCPGTRRGCRAAGRSRARRGGWRRPPSPSETPGAVLNDSVTAGNCPWWLSDSGAAVVSKCANADERHRRRRSPSARRCCAARRVAAGTRASPRGSRGTG